MVHEGLYARTGGTFSLYLSVINNVRKLLINDVWSVIRFTKGTRVIRNVVSVLYPGKSRDKTSTSLTNGRSIIPIFH